MCCNPYDRFVNYWRDAEFITRLWIVSCCLSPLFIITGLPCLLVGIQDLNSVYFAVPLCPMVNTSLSYVSYSFDATQKTCPSAGVFASQAITYPTVTLRKDCTYEVEVWMPTSITEGSISFSVFIGDVSDTSALQINNDTIVLTYVSTSDKSGSTVTAYDPSTPSCMDASSGCSETLSSDYGYQTLSGTAVKSASTAKFSLLLNGLSLSSPTTISTAYLRFTYTKLDSLAVAGIVLLSIGVFLLTWPILILLCALFADSD